MPTLTQARRRSASIWESPADFAIKYGSICNWCNWLILSGFAILTQRTSRLNLFYLHTCVLDCPQGVIKNVLSISWKSEGFIDWSVTCLQGFLSLQLLQYGDVWDWRHVDTQLHFWLCNGLCRRQELIATHRSCNVGFRIPGRSYRQHSWPNRLKPHVTWK